MKLTVPTGHGEVLMEPAYHAWASLARAGAQAAQSWTFEVAGVPAAELRRLARSEAIGIGQRYSARIGVRPAQLEPAVEPAAEPAVEPSAERSVGPLVVMTGHQPDLFHPGVWVKNFLIDRLARDLGAIGLNLVVDSDAVTEVGLRAPTMTPGLGVREIRLCVPKGAQATYAASPPVAQSDLARFRQEGQGALDTLCARAIACHFREFCDVLEEAGGQVESLAEHLTFARRRYENRAATTRYLEVPLTTVSGGRAFLTFVADLALGARRFHEAYNGALQAHRARNRTRSAAQPFPDLAADPARGFELPLWHLGAGGRSDVWVFTHEDGTLELTSDGVSLGRLPASPAEAIAALVEAAPRLSPKALLLTAFHRLFVSDLFLHGVGGARYDRITDVFCQTYYGVEPPPFVVASMTMFLPLGAKVVFQRDVDEVERKLERLTHNPDDFLDDEDLELSAQDSQRALALAAEKQELVKQIALADADKRALGVRIREVNLALGELFRPIGDALRTQVQTLRAARAASDLVTDRTYPFCFWDPREIQDKAR